MDSSRQPDSNETIADSIRPLAVELPQLLVSSPGRLATEVSLETATGVPQLRAIYDSIRLIRRMPIRLLRTLADPWLVCYPSISSTESYSHDPATSHIPFNSSRRPDSNKTIANSIRPLAVELPQLLVSSPGGVATEFSLVSATGGPQP